MLAAPRMRFALGVVPALLGLVYAAALSSDVANAAGKAKPRAPTAVQQPADGTLPPPTQDMVESILSAVRSGNIDDLRDAIDWNEIKPDLAAEPVSDPIAFWKTLPKDSQGRDILAVLGSLLEGKPAVVPLGRDAENNRLYVWPRFADTAPSKLSPEDMAALTALVAPDDLAAMLAQDRYTGWRLVIGADGTWHALRKMQP